MCACDTFTRSFDSFQPHQNCIRLAVSAQLRLGGCTEAFKEPELDRGWAQSQQVYPSAHPPWCVLLQVTLMAALLFANMVDAQADCDDVNDKQHKSFIEALKAAAPEWTFEQINFVAGRRGTVVEDAFYNKLERLNAHARKNDKILAAHVHCIGEAHDTVMQSYSQQIHGSSGYHRRTRRRRWIPLEHKCMCKQVTIFCHQLLKKGEDGAKLESDEQTNGVTHRRHGTSIKNV